MQLTATEVKMDHVNGNGQISPDPENLSLAEADSIGKSFVRQFYTVLSTAPEEVAKFYGHKSIFQFNDSTAVGQKEIGSFFASAFPEKRKMKIYTIKGVPSFNSGIVLQVFGELNEKRFLQTFILGQQTAKKYYVENDLLQYIDNAFVDPKAVEEKPRSNGKVPSDVRLQAAVEKPVVKSPIRPPTAPSAPKETNGISAPPQAPVSKPQTKSSETQQPKQEHQPKSQQHPSKPAPQQHPPAAPVAESPPKPKTWATLVGGGVKQQPPQPQQFTHLPGGQTKSPQKPVAPQNGISLQPAAPIPQSNSANERKIFLGNIVRNIVPDSTVSAETEVKGIFNKLGGQVENVYIPGKVLDNPNDTTKFAFAFITFTTPEAAQKIFEHADKDEKGVFHIQLKVEAFGFDGLATISEQRERSFGGPGGFRGGARGGFRNSRGGSFPARGRGGPGRGAARNGFPQQANA